MTLKPCKYSDLRHRAAVCAAACHAIIKPACCSTQGAKWQPSSCTGQQSCPCVSLLPLLPSEHHTVQLFASTAYAVLAGAAHQAPTHTHPAVNARVNTTTVYNKAKETENKLGPLNDFQLMLNWGPARHCNKNYSSPRASLLEMAFHNRRLHHTSKPTAQHCTTCLWPQFRSTAC